MTESSRPTLASRLVLAAILGLGAMAVWDIAVGLIFAAAQPLARDVAVNSNDSRELAEWLMVVLFGSPSVLAAYHSAFQAMPAPWSPQILVTCALAIVAAVQCYRRQRRYMNDEAVAWAMFALLLGLPGLVGYFLHRRWPATEYCANCRKTSPRDRDACLHCSTPFPPPAPKGIEIFA
jgi:hypothetical protein